MRWPAISLVAIVLFGGTSACSDDDSGSTTGGLQGSITVAAASSLTEAFTEIGDDFEAAHPGTEITFTFDASSALARQIASGAPVDVFASADEANMAKVVYGGGGEPAVFARNELEIATKPGNPEGVKTFTDLMDVGTVALCAAEVPCGALAEEVISNAGVVIPEDHVTRAERVKGVVTAVAEGDADAGLVYVTDVIAAGDRLTGVKIPAAHNATTAYPIVALADAGNADLPDAFVEYVLSHDGQATLRSYGFTSP